MRLALLDAFVVQGLPSHCCHCYSWFDEFQWPCLRVRVSPNSRCSIGGGWGQHAWRRSHPLAGTPV